MHAVIDSDIFLYEFGNATDSEYQPLAWPLVQARVQGRIKGILKAVGATSHQLYLTSTDKSNFRYEVATIKPYKGNRAGDKPHHYSKIREFLIDNRGAIEVFGMEADDALSIASYKSFFHDEQPDEDRVVICTRDKDLLMVPGYHYSWGVGHQEETPLWYQTELEGLKCFYKQLLTGDAVDNILGLYGVGKASAHVKKIDDCISEVEMYYQVRKQYSLRFGSYADKFLLENARLLWMLEFKGERWIPPVFDGPGWDIDQD